MTEALEVRTAHADMSEVVREMAPRVDDESIRLPTERPIADGEWVRFTVLLRDGTTVFEGVGRAQGTKPEGRKFSVQLSLLQFDDATRSCMSADAARARSLGRRRAERARRERADGASVAEEHRRRPRCRRRCRGSRACRVRTTISTPPKRPTSIPPPPPVPGAGPKRESHRPRAASVLPKAPRRRRSPRGRARPPPRRACLKARDGF
jgi:hypothetical protein